MEYPGFPFRFGISKVPSISSQLVPFNYVEISSVVIFQEFTCVCPGIQQTLEYKTIVCR